jgi:DNA polymerase/3'-5' exonuclease PolX
MSSTRATNAAARRKLQEVPGIGAALAAKLGRRGITTRAQLRAVIDELPREAQAHLRYNVSRAIPSTVAAAVTDELKARLSFDGPTGRRRRYPTIAVGSVRRSAPRSKDLDVLVVVPDEGAVRGLLASAELADRRGKADTLTPVESYAAGDRRRSFIVRRAPKGGRAKYYAVDLFLATEEEKPFALFHFTGGRDYNIRVRAHAKRAGCILNQYGLFCANASRAARSKNGKRRRAPGSKAIKTERDLARFLGVTYRPPKER